MCGSTDEITQERTTSADFASLSEMGFLPKFLRCCGGYKKKFQLQKTLQGFICKNWCSVPVPLYFPTVIMTANPLSPA